MYGRRNVHNRRVEIADPAIEQLEHLHFGRGLGVKIQGGGIGQAA